MNRLRVAWPAAPALVAVAALVMQVVPLAGAGAQSASDQQKIDSQIESLKSQIGEASAEEAKLLVDIDASSATKRTLDAKVAALDGQISVVQRNLGAAQSKLAAAEAEQRGAEARLNAAQQELAAARIKLANFAVAAYTGQSEAMQFLTATLKARSIDELVAKRNYMKSVGATQAETIALDERLRNEVKDLAGALAVAAGEADRQAKAVEGQKAELETQRNAQQQVRAQVVAEIRHSESLKAEVVARKDQFVAEENKLQAQSDAIAAELKARADAQRAAAAAGGTVTLAPAAGGFLRPVSGPITSPFGYRVHPIYGTTIFHAGVDIGADTGTPIAAAQSGVVVSAGWIDGYGNATIIDHGGAVTTLYGHQSALGVSAGDKVTRGQTIGRVGCTGSCTGPHLHFEVRVNGTPVDPMTYIS